MITTFISFWSRNWGNPKAAQGQHPIRKKKENTTVEPDLLAEADVQQAFDAYNETARLSGLPIARELSPDRQNGLRAALKQHGLSGWREGLSYLRASPWHCGEGGNGWRADLDWILEKPAKFQKLIERGRSNGLQKSNGAALPDNVQRFEAAKKAAKASENVVYMQVPTSC